MMSAIQLDDSSLPDIIEAQLTLSYGRLTKLIREIVNQGNGHENDIARLRERLDRLERENGMLRSQMSGLVSKQESGETVLNDAVADMREEMKELYSGLMHCSAEAQQAAREECHVAKSSAQEALSHLEHQLHECVGELVQHQGRLQTCENFVHLWAGDANTIKSLMNSHSAGDGTSSASSPTEWATFLQGLPALAYFNDEMAVLRSLIQTQASEVIKTKMIEAAASAGNGGKAVSEDGSRRLSSTVLSSRNRSIHTQQQQLEDMQRDITAAIRDLQGRLNAVENVQQQGPPRPGAMTFADYSSDNSGTKKSSTSLHSPDVSTESRLTRLEGRLSAMVSASLKRGRCKASGRNETTSKSSMSKGNADSEAGASATGSDTSNKDESTHMLPAHDGNSCSGSDDGREVLACESGMRSSIVGAPLAEVDAVALADLDYRVKHLESVVNGIPSALLQSATAVAADSSFAADSNQASNLDDTHPRGDGASNHTSNISMDTTTAVQASNNADNRNNDRTDVRAPVGSDGQSSSQLGSRTSYSSARPTSHELEQHDNATQLPSVAPNAHTGGDEHAGDKEGAGDSATEIGVALPGLPQLVGARAGRSSASAYSTSSSRHTVGYGGAADSIAHDGRTASDTAPVLAPAMTQVERQQPQQPQQIGSGAGVAVDSLDKSAVEALRGRTPSNSLASLMPSVSGRFRSIHLEPESGLCRRVMLLEEGVAVLEMNKADRDELLAMQMSLREAISRCESAVHAVAHTGAAPSRQRQNDSLNTNNMHNKQLSASREVYTTDNRTDLAAGFPSCNRPSTSTRGRESRGSAPSLPSGGACFVGRPLYVNSASLNLRDGARITSATVSPCTPP